jgi:L-iditol 2-dehydrogenase
MRRAMPLVADGRIRVNELHTHTFALDDFETAIDAFNERRDGALKVILEP